MKALFFLFLAFSAAGAWSQVSTTVPQPTPAAPSKFDPSLLGGTKPILTEQEQAGVDITESWKDKSMQTLVSKPGVSPSTQFRFGESYPSVVCSILQLTDIELQPGEVVTAINVGDTTRWSIESAKSGSGTDQVEHLIVKPRDIGLSTSVVVTTDRRTYHLLLVSSQGEFMHDVTFLYSDVPSPSPTPVAENAAVSTSPVVSDPPKRKSHGETDSKQVKLVAKDPPADDADESYAVSGKAEWKPVSVYSKDGKTYLEMPASVRHKEAPVLFEEKKAGWFHHDMVLVNYRVHGRWYVVDRVLDKATLVSGVGSGQEKVTITHVNLVAKVEGAANGK